VPSSSASFGSLETMGAADIASVPTMGSGQLRRLAEAAASEGGGSELWAVLAARCEEYADRLKYWDAVLILQSFSAAGVDNRALSLRLADALSAKTSKMAPKHVLDLFAVYEAQGLRPRALYVELLHTVVRLSGSMYAEEVSLTLQALARYQLGNPTVVAQLIRTVRGQLKEYRLRYLCGVTGALGSLRACPSALLVELDARARFEVDTVPVQELMDNLQSFPLLEYSWQPYEDLCLNELTSRTKSFRTSEDIDQLVKPFDAMLFLQVRGLLEDSFLLALNQWCLRGVHRPNVLSERRPTTHQLVTLHDKCQERGLEGSPALQDAIRYFVESGGGRWQVLSTQPLRYKNRRKYIRSDDPLHGIEVPPLPDELVLGELNVARRPMEDLPGLPTSSLDYGLAEGNRPRRSQIVKKPSAPSPLLAEGQTTVNCWVTTRKGPRPRRPRDPGLKKIKRLDMPRMPFWMQGGWQMRPKYQPGQKLGRYPYAGVPLSKRGAGWVLRR